MAKDAVATMGAILADDVGGRDAVHVAVISVVAGEQMRPGQHVCVDTYYTEPRAYVDGGDTVGVVDPFISHPVSKGSRFWLYLYPRTITSLSHNWTHPAFEDVKAVYNAPAEKLASERWLRNWIECHDCPSYEAMVAAATASDDAWDDEYRVRIEDNYVHVGGRDASGEIPSEFWHHMEIVTGKKMTKRPTYFSCSC